MKAEYKVFFNNAWYNKYSAPLALAVLRIMKGLDSESNKASLEKLITESYTILIGYSHDPRGKNKESIAGIDLQIRRDPYRSSRLVNIYNPTEAIEKIVLGGKENEYSSIVHIAHRFPEISMLLNIGENIEKDIGIMHGLSIGDY